MSDQEDEEFLRELTREFLQDIKVKLELALLSDQNPDWQQIKIVAHQTKGSAATFGYPELGTLALEIDTLVKKQDFFSATPKAREFLTRVQVLLEDLSLTR